MINLFDKIRFRLQDHCESGDCRKFCHECDFKTALRIVDEVEAEYGNGFIPCEKELPPTPERNPEFEGHRVELYFVSVKDEKYPFRAIWNGKQFTDGLMEVHPEAWMPLPETYKPEKGAQDESTDM